MRHRSKKVKFNFGKDAKDMLVRQLISNFLLKGGMVTTHKKAKVAQSAVERLVTKARQKTESSKNILLKRIAKPSLVSLLQERIVPSAKEKTSGYTRIVKLFFRKTDGAQIVRLEWTFPIQPLQTKKEIKPETTEKKIEKTKKV